MNDAQQRIWSMGVTSLLEPFGFEAAGSGLSKTTQHVAQRISLVPHSEVPSRFKVVLEVPELSKQAELGMLAKGKPHWWDTDTHSEKAIIADVTTAVLEHGLSWFQSTVAGGS
jgi:hypothetical protein